MVKMKDVCASIIEIDKNVYTVSDFGNITSFSENKVYKFPSNDSTRYLHQCKICDNILVLRSSHSPNEPIIDSKIFDPKTCVWKELKIEVKRYNFSAVEYMGMVWILGGQSIENSQRGCTSSIEIYNPITDTLKPSPIKMCCKRSRHSSIVYKDKVYVFGGFNYEGSLGKLSSVEMYSPKSNKFVMMAPMKEVHSSFACCRIKNLVYVIDGNCNVDHSIEIYNLDTDTWSIGDGFPFSIEIGLGFKACAIEHELSDLVNNTEVEVVEASKTNKAKQNKSFSFFNIFQTEK